MSKDPTLQNAHHTLTESSLSLDLHETWAAAVTSLPFLILMIGLASNFIVETRDRLEGTGKRINRAISIKTKLIVEVYGVGDATKSAEWISFFSGYM